MKNITVFLSENFQFLEVKFSTYLNRCVFLMFFLIFPRKLDLIVSNLHEMSKPVF